MCAPGITFLPHIQDAQYCIPSAELNIYVLEPVEDACVRQGSASRTGNLSQVGGDITSEHQLRSSASVSVTKSCLVVQWLRLRAVLLEGARFHPWSGD